MPEASELGASDDDLEARFEDAYRVEWASVHDYAQELINDLGVRRRSEGGGEQDQRRECEGDVGSHRGRYRMMTNFWMVRSPARNRSSPDSESVMSSVTVMTAM